MEMLESIVSGTWNAVKKGIVGLTTLAMLSSPVSGEETADSLKQIQSLNCPKSKAKYSRELVIKKNPGMDYSRLSQDGFQVRDFYEECDSNKIKHRADYTFTIETDSIENPIEKAWVLVHYAKWMPEIGTPEVSVQLKQGGEYVQLQKKEEKSILNEYDKTVYAIQEGGFFCKKMQLTPVSSESLSESELFNLTKLTLEKIYFPSKKLKGNNLTELFANIDKKDLEMLKGEIKVIAYRIDDKITGLKISAPHESERDIYGEGLHITYSITTPKVRETGNPAEIGPE